MAKVLIIDDEPSDRALFDMKLRDQGYDVLFAHSGWKGLQLYRQERPDVVVLDLRMPELDGVMNLKQPVIIWAGDTTPETEGQVRALGVSEFIVKGSSMKLLVDTLKSLLKPPTLAMGGSAVK
jgi:DNA-binding response OmpR family regulator